MNCRPYLQKNYRVIYYVTMDATLHILSEKSLKQDTHLWIMQHMFRTHPTYNNDLYIVSYYRVFILITGWFMKSKPKINM
jgi:hypothetical protein